MSRGQANESPGGGYPDDGGAAAHARDRALDDDGGRRTRGPDDGGSRSGLRVLVVEDSRTVADRIVEMLATELPVDSIETVDSEPDALAAPGPWDAAIVDLSLREGNGFSVLRALQRRAEPRPWVVVLTDHARAEFRSLAATFGARAFLHKSSEFERLVDVLRPLAERRAPQRRH